jgi:hypothetical protein
MGATLARVKRLETLARARTARADPRLGRWKVDPALLMVDAGWRPDGWQAEFLRCTDRQVLMLCSRQCGKSLAVSMLALHTALTRPGSLTTIVAQRQDTAAETLRKAVTAYYRCGAPVPVLNRGKTYFELATGSRIPAHPGDEQAMHGPTADLLLIDEAARVPDAVFHAASPQLSASGGRFVALSTAFAQSGFFFREYTNGTGYHRFNVTARECPRHSPEFLAGEKRRMGDWWFNSAYLNVFGADVHAVFDPAAVDRMFTDELLPLDDEFDRADHPAADAGPAISVGITVDLDLTPLEGF